MCEDSSGTEEASRVAQSGDTIKRATDAKLFDSRETNKESKARRNPKPTMVKMHKSFAMRQIRKKRSVVRLAHHPIQPQAQSQHRALVAL